MVYGIKRAVLGIGVFLVKTGVILVKSVWLYWLNRFGYMVFLLVFLGFRSGNDLHIRIPGAGTT